MKKNKKIKAWNIIKLIFGTLFIIILLDNLGYYGGLGIIIFLLVMLYKRWTSPTGKAMQENTKNMFETLAGGKTKKEFSKHIFKTLYLVTIYHLFVKPYRIIKKIFIKENGIN